MIKVTKRDDKCTGLSKLEDALVLFEEKLRNENDGEEYYHLIIIGEYNRQTCNEIEKIYTEAGWKDVKCRTSSENGEKPGLTGLILYS